MKLFPPPSPKYTYSSTFELHIFDGPSEIEPNKNKLRKFKRKYQIQIAGDVQSDTVKVNING